MAEEISTQKQAVVDEYLKAHPTAHLTACGDAWQVGKKKYVYTVTFRLQYNWKSYGNGSVEKLKAFLALDCSNEKALADFVAKYPKDKDGVAPATPSPVKTESTVKNVLFQTTLPAPTVTSVKTVDDIWRAKAINAGIANVDELFAKHEGKPTFYKAVTCGQPEYRKQHDPHNHWVNNYLLKHGAKLIPEIFTKYPEIFTNKQAKIAELQKQLNELINA